MKDPIQGALDAVREVDFRVRQVRLLWSEAERASAAEVETLRAELARKDEDVERFRARAEQELKRLRRSNEQVREVLGANHGESPVEAAKRLRADKDAMGREIERLRNERDVALARVVKLEKSCREGEQEVQALQESWSAVRAKRDKAVARVEELEREVAAVRSLRQTVRDECAAALFEVFRTSETLDTAFYGFAAALDVVAKELSALRKDRETLNRVRSAVEVKS